MFGGKQVVVCGYGEVRGQIFPFFPLGISCVKSAHPWHSLTHPQLFALHLQDPPDLRNLPKTESFLHFVIIKEMPKLNLLKIYIKYSEYL